MRRIHALTDKSMHPVARLGSQIRSATARRDEGAACRGKSGPIYFLTPEREAKLREKCSLSMARDNAMIESIVGLPGPVGMPAIMAAAAAAGQDLDDWSEKG